MGTGEAIRLVDIRPVERFVLSDDSTTDDPHEVTDEIRSFVEVRTAAGLSAELIELGGVMPLAGAAG